MVKIPWDLDDESFMSVEEVDLFNAPLLMRLIIWSGVVTLT